MGLDFLEKLTLGGNGLLEGRLQVGLRARGVVPGGEDGAIADRAGGQRLFRYQSAI